MATSVHIPGPLLKKADERARELGISRNRLIVRALERELNESTEWSPGFFEELLAVDDDGKKAVDEMRAAIQEHRRSKPPLQF
jgi:metal-responsive CopG/Arc/MetJ family transcriptional regulator